MSLLVFRPTPGPRKLRSISTDRLIVWYQKFEHRQRVYVVRITWSG